ncbi:hypothetical protein HNY73_003594 [Argiope bruennichi]|uniref:Uncharacterized protein n=1 Tax=Argiope bruennichi TaxID=94029 RepID=A0A8T0FN32_ARGBR|nr:hypothetical protein HNY73_003594 [Argiope bruennichi]
MRSTLSLCVLVVLSIGLVAAQDSNWGLKVKCYVVEGEVVCPGCRQRAGLSCPRFDPDMNRICGQATPPPDIEEENTPECDEAATETKAPEKREVPEELEEGTCRWNGDCPCPQICCRAGEGCPRRCKMGIRLPPPWGKR